VLRYLEGLTYPVRKDVLVHAARQKGAPNDVVGALQQLPKNDFASPQEVIDAYPTLG
jgi:hypothetical protein